MKKGYTLIETMIVVAILAAIAVLMWSTVLRTTRFARQRGIVQIAELISQQLQRRYKLQGGFPVNQEDFEAFLKDNRYFEAVPKNPYWSGDPEKGWKWDAASRKVSAVNNGNKMVYEITVSVPEGNSGSVYVRPSTYGGDG